MLLLFVIILLVVGLAIIGALYSLFSPFFQQLGDIKQYNMAYYGAVSSVERGMLALRYHGPGYEHTSGRKNTSTGRDAFGNTHDASSSDFGLLKDGDMYWSISSRSHTIPRTGEGNVPYALRGETSSDYLTLGYDSLMEYTFDLDTDTSDDIYTLSPNSNYQRDSGLGKVSLYARLPQLVYRGYGNEQLIESCNTSSTYSWCDWDSDGVGNDLVIDRSLEGSHKGPQKSEFFRIVPRVDVNYVDGVVRVNDTLIRESHINQTTTNKATAIWGGNGNFSNPIRVDSYLGNANPPQQNIIGPTGVLNMLGGQSFKSILQIRSVTDLKLLLGLARKLQISGGKLYPFLETKLETDAPIADLYYRVDGVGRVGSYDVIVRTKKPTSDRSLFGSFTIVF